MSAAALIEMKNRYRPIAAIGRGGMAEVLLTLMDAGGGVTKVVVLKRVWPDLASDHAFVSMFHDEARLSIRLNHPNVTQTYEVIEDDGQLAIAMEYLHGQTMTAVMNRLGGPRELSLQLRLRVVADVLAGLHYAHELTDYGGTPLGVVHRDVSPNNVFVTYDGQVKLMDFGVAKTEAAGQRTRPGGIAGKLAYLAPEYLRNDYSIDRRADVFGVGVMLWEMLSGRRLWQGKADAEIVHHLAAGVKVPDLPPDNNRPPVLGGIVARALAVNPDERYPSAAELEIDLRNVMVGAADSHSRTLGRVVSHAFATARAERELTIARALVTGKAVAQAVPGWVTDPGWARAIDHFLANADEVLDVTVVDESNVVSESVIPRRRLVPPLPPPPPAPVRRRPSRVGLGSAIAGMTMVAAIVGLIVTRSPLGASAPPVRATPAMAAAPARAEIAPLPAVAKAAPPPTIAPPAPEVAAAPAVALEPSTLPTSAATKSQFARRAHGARHEDHDGTDRRAADTRDDTLPFSDPPLERKRPASLRAIDESDPFK
jgi:tRNA A-37 threonylcarbamoyl transferase component Bud32